MSKEGMAAMATFLKSGGAVTMCPSGAAGERLPHFDERYSAEMSIQSKARGGNIKAIQARRASRLARA